MTVKESTLCHTYMKKYSISPLTVMIVAAFIVIDGSWFSLYTAACALWHELAHIAAVKIAGGALRSFSVRRFGMGIKTDALSYRAEAGVALAGPLASLLAAGVFMVTARCFCFNETTVFLFFSNLALFCLNILPIFPLDGGRALRAILLSRISYGRAMAVSKAISVIFLLPLCTLSVIILVKTGYNLSLLIICIYLAVLLTGAVKNEN